MRSSTGHHFVALDHVRALAAFLVFAWHFLHADAGTPVPLAGAPSLPPLALIDEGHTGVALFMTLSGYLFAKLLDGRRFSVTAFLWNRFIRLAPLLFFVFLVIAIRIAASGGDPVRFLAGLWRGLLMPAWPNGGWSITTELHFYILLPLILWLCRHSRWHLAGIILLAIALRTAVFMYRGEVQSFAYWTIIGRIDQFTLGIAAFYCAESIQGKPRLVLLATALFVLFYWWFNAAGGFYLIHAYPSPSPIWVVLPTIEGLFYGLFIAWYDGTNPRADRPLSKLLQKLGEYSYSIYLLHFFGVFAAATWIHRHVMDLSNFYVALPWAMVCFLLMLIPGYLSFRLIESPFLRFRTNYILPTGVPPAHAPTAHKSQSDA